MSVKCKQVTFLHLFKWHIEIVWEKYPFFQNHMHQSKQRGSHQWAGWRQAAVSIMPALPLFMVCWWLLHSTGSGCKWLHGVSRGISRCAAHHPSSLSPQEAVPAKHVCLGNGICGKLSLRNKPLMKRLPLSQEMWDSQMSSTRGPTVVDGKRSLTD